MTTLGRSAGQGGTDESPRLRSDLLSGQYAQSVRIVCLNTADDGLRDDSWTPTGRDALTENLSDDSRHTGVTRSISSSPFLLIRNSGLHRLGSGRGRLNGRLRLGGRNSRSGDLRGRDGVPLAYNLRVLDLRLAPRAVIDEQHRDQARGRNRGCDQRRAKSRFRVLGHSRKGTTAQRTMFQGDRGAVESRCGGQVHRPSARQLDENQTPSKDRGNKAGAFTRRKGGRGHAQDTS